MTNTNELLPCPFCGGMPVCLKVGEKVCFYKISCNDIDNHRFDVFGMAKEEAIKLWNTYAQSEQSESLKSENKRLREALETVNIFFEQVISDYSFGKRVTPITVNEIIEFAEEGRKTITSILETKDKE